MWVTVMLMGELVTTITNKFKYKGGRDVFTDLEDKYSTKGLCRLPFHTIYINVHQFLEEVAHRYPEEGRTTQERKSQRKENKKKKFIPRNPS
ncbi:hypothetical protein KY284_007989 [Solanum tuberosum]|nr:hypothetical protein KY284_007989 [Solanum tuberosum]